MHLAGFLMRGEVSENDTYNMMLAALERQPEGVDANAEKNIGSVVRTTAHKLANGEHVTGGPSVEEFASGLTKKLPAALGWGPRSYEYTDAGNAERFVAARGNDFLWVRERKEWIVWDGCRWAPGDAGDVQEALREVMRTIHRDPEFTSDQEEQRAIASFARASQNKTRIDGAMQAVQDKLRVREEDLDQDPWLLNVENGTIDLRKGQLKRHDRADKITKLAPMRFDPNAGASRFLRFLKQVLVEDELIAFVQRFLGYSLTGSTEERAMAVLHGEEKNGKTTLVKLFGDQLGDYSFTAPPHIVLRRKMSGSDAQDQLAELKGARFVSMSETPRDVQLEEATVKQITGNDEINARAPFACPFVYTPEFKLWMSTNHKPEIPDGSEAIWDRIRLIPFNHRFKGKDADTKLPEKLREELPGILAWAVRGCVDWGGGGLGSSRAVDAATAAYRSETDVTQRFFNDICVFGPEYSIGKKALYQAWEKWAVEDGVEPGNQTSFTRLVSERSKTLKLEDKKAKNGTRFWRGIGLQSAVRLGSEDHVPSPESPANVQKTEGGRHFGENFSEVQSLPLIEGSSQKIDEKVPSGPQSAVPFEFENEFGRVFFVGGDE